jgi:hypothetical protein
MRNNTEDTINRGFEVFFVVQNKTLGNGYGTFKKNDKKYLKLEKYKAN